MSEITKYYAPIITCGTVEGHGDICVVKYEDHIAKVKELQGQVSGMRNVLSDVANNTPAIFKGDGFMEHDNRRISEYRITTDMMKNIKEALKEAK